MLPVTTIGRPVREDPPPVAKSQKPLKTITLTVDAVVKSKVSQHCHGFLDIPYEVLSEICAFLEPQDLRNLTLTSKGLRNALMSRESQQIWKSARVRTYGPMPDCPDSMSEPQYVRFLFAPECFACDRPATHIDVFNFVKSCEACHENNFFNEKQVRSKFRALPVKLRFPPKDDRVWMRKNEKRYYQPRVKADHDQYRLTLRSISDPDELAAYETTSSIQMEESVKISRVIDKWMQAESTKQGYERDDFYRRRRQSIRDKMAELGHKWFDICFEASDVEKLHDLTDEEWTIMRSAYESSAITNKARREDAAERQKGASVQDDYASSDDSDCWKL